MTILITGAAGMVGGYFDALSARFDERLELATSADLDVTDLDAVRARFDAERYRAVINLAAATDVDRCEREPNWAYALNAAGAKNVALAAAEHDATVVQVSTTMVFGGDGRSGPKSELDDPCPVNTYGRSKLRGEELARQVSGKSFIVRTCWVMGGGAADKKFVGKVADRLRAGDPIKAVDDQLGSPTYAHDLVCAIAALLATRAYGVYHVTNTGSATRLAMAREMKAILQSASDIEGVGADTWPLDAARAADDSSVSYALAPLGLGDIMPTWQDALARYLSSWQR